LTEKCGSDTFVSFFFVQFHSQQSLQSATILKSIMKQALSQAGVAKEELSSLEFMQQRLESRPQNLVNFFHTVVKRFKRLYIIIDGLDECEKPDRDDLLDALSSLLRTVSNVQIFLASRDSIQNQIKRAFPRRFYHLSTGTSSTRSDIATYVNAAIAEKLRKEELNVADQHLINDIKAALKKGADGM
jgi:hypothetical protein